MNDAYGEALARVHDEGFTQLARGAAVQLLAELGGRAGGMVVELGCGSGVTLSAAVDAGFDALGVDLSDALLDRARLRVPSGAFTCGSFLDVELPRCVAVAAIGEVFNYAFDTRSDAHRAAYFCDVFEALEPGGVFLFDVATPARAESYPAPRVWFENDDWVLLVEIRVADRGRTLERHISTFTRRDDLFTRSNEVHRLTLLEAPDITRELEQAGFDVRTIERYGDVAILPGSVAFVAVKPHL